MLYKDKDNYNVNEDSVRIEDFYRELKKYPVEDGMVQKAWIAEIFEKIKFKPLQMPIG